MRTRCPCAEMIDRTRARGQQPQKATPGIPTSLGLQDQSSSSCEHFAVRIHANFLLHIGTNDLGYPCVQEEGPSVDAGKAGQEPWHQHFQLHGLREGRWCLPCTSADHMHLQVQCPKCQQCRPFRRDPGNSTGETQHCQLLGESLGIWKFLYMSDWHHP